MAKRLRWTEFAKSQRKDILEYWNQRNKSKNYSRKLNKLFNEIALVIAEYPEIGIRIFKADFHAKLIKDYYIVYKISEDTIEILSLFDTRQNPEKLSKILGYDH